jgi:hypothetical protein
LAAVPPRDRFWTVRKLPQASEILARLASPPDPHPGESERATLCLELQRSLATPPVFRNAVVRLVAEQRRALRLSEITEPFTDTDTAVVR